MPRSTEAVNKLSSACSSQLVQHASPVGASAIKTPGNRRTPQRAIWKRSLQFTQCSTGSNPMGSISVKSVGKAYRQYPSRFGRLLEWMSPSRIVRHDLRWVLRDISFEVKQGEAVGIVGINGAGKSTLLKMITGTTQPTTGSIAVSGRVAAMLELGWASTPILRGGRTSSWRGSCLVIARTK